MGKVIFGSSGVLAIIVALLVGYSQIASDRGWLPFPGPSDNPVPEPPQTTASPAPEVPSVPPPDKSTQSSTPPNTPVPTPTATPKPLPEFPISSTFDDDDESWAVVGNGGTGRPKYEIAGGNPGGFITETDRTSVTFYYHAPSKFLGDRSLAYGHSLMFDIIQSHTSNQYSRPDVMLIGRGVVLEVDAGPNPALSWTSYEVPLHESGGWTIQSTGVIATREDILLVLSSLEDLRIRGEFSRDDPRDRTALDNVIMNGETQ